jgi:hypothetical protein
MVFETDIIIILVNEMKVLAFPKEAIAGTVWVIKSLLVCFPDVIFLVVNRSKRWSTEI